MKKAIWYMIVLRMNFKSDDFFFEKLNMEDSRSIFWRQMSKLNPSVIWINNGCTYLHKTWIQTDRTRKVKRKKIHRNLVKKRSREENKSWAESSCDLVFESIKKWKKRKLHDKNHMAKSRFRYDMIFCQFHYLHQTRTLLAGKIDNILHLQQRVAQLSTLTHQRMCFCFFFFMQNTFKQFDRVISWVTTEKIQKTTSDVARVFRSSMIWK